MTDKLKPKEIIEIIRRNYFYIDEHGVGRQTPLDKYAKDVTKEIMEIKNVFMRT